MRSPEVGLGEGLRSGRALPAYGRAVARSAAESSKGSGASSRRAFQVSRLIEDQPPVIRRYRRSTKKVIFISSHQASSSSARAPSTHIGSVRTMAELGEAGVRWSGRRPRGRALHRALPLHSQPLLLPDGVGGKERGAQQGDRFLAQAQKLDAVNPEVGRAALRLLSPRPAVTPAAQAAPG